MQTLDEAYGVLLTSRQYTVSRTLGDLHRRILGKSGRPTVEARIQRVFAKFRAWDSSNDVPPNDERPG